MPGGDFLDTNVLVYAFASQDERKRGIADQLIRDGLLRDSATISHQVVQEALNVLSRANSPIQDVEADDFLRNVLMPLWRVSPSPTLYQQSLKLRERYGYSFYDSLIIAAALEVGCARILSEDLQHGQRIESLVIEDPFRQ